MKIKKEVTEIITIQFPLFAKTGQLYYKIVEENNKSILISCAGMCDTPQVQSIYKEHLFQCGFEYEVITEAEFKEAYEKTEKYLRELI